MTAAFDRRGACPALASPMQTGDGLLVRLNPVREGLTPKQLIGLCESAARHGNGAVEITARGSFQIRGLTEVSTAELAADVNALGIAVRTGVPVDTPPLAGLDPSEISDPRPLAALIRDGIEAAGLAGRLGPKVSVVVDGVGAIGLADVIADVRVVAGRRRTGALWRMALAGTAHTAAPMGASTERGAAGFVVDLLSQIAELGIEGRGRDLLDSVSSIAPPSVLTDISPTRGEITRCTNSAHSGPMTIGESLAAGLIFPLVGEMSGRTEGGDVGRYNFRPMLLTDNQVALCIALPFGNAGAETLAELGRRAEALGISEFRFSPGRMLIALCPDARSAAFLNHTALDLGFITDPADPRLAMSACAGEPGCASAHLATRKLAERLAAEQPELVQAAGQIHVSGCAKGCAHPAAAPLTFVGSTQGVGVVANGTARNAPLMHLKPEEVAARLPELIRAARQHQ